MKIKNLSVLLALIACPVALFATPANDLKIEDAAKASYNFRVVLEDRVTAKAANGVVTLTGTVLDGADKDLAAGTVENLPSVVSVTNQIKVEPSFPEHSDGWMAFKIRGLLLVRANVSAINTKVVVTDGNVILTGTADNLAQKELTEAYAKDIDGVKTVKNDITVTDKPAAAPVGETMDDASITTQVKYALLTHKSTSTFKTTVVTTNGVVRITGDADSAAQKTLVAKLAADVRGVKSVTNDLTVKN